MSGKRVRPDATVRGLGPDTTRVPEVVHTMDVSNSEVDIVTDAELQMTWLRRDYRFIGGAIAGGILLVVGMLFVLTSKDAPDAAPPQELGVVETAPTNVEPAKLPVPPAEALAAPAAEPEMAQATPKARPKALRAGAGARVAKGKVARTKAKQRATAQRKKKARLKASAALR